MEFGVLGPVEARDHGRQVPLGHSRQRSVLAVLAIDAARVVPTEQLIDRLWGDDPPSTARNVLHSYVARLRAAFNKASDGRSLLRQASGGYVLDVDPDTIDLHRFRRLTAAAREADKGTAVTVLREALSLWRGPAFAGLSSPWLRRLADALDAEFWSARLRVSEIELGLGRHAELVSELRAWAAEHPFDERLAGQLMLALFGCGQRAAALSCYHDIRHRLVEELGVEPGRELQQLYQQILQDEEAQAPPSHAGRVPPPFQLPRDTPDFTGRETELARLRDLFEAAGSGGSPAPLVAVIHGTAGSGKTALGVHFAHQIAQRFPDGVLHTDLRGYDPYQPPLRPEEALGYFLRALGTDPADIPAGLSEKASLYRSWLADKRVLIVLDNASTPGQVRPLLPGSAGSAVIVTSRNRLDGLAARDGARRLSLDVLKEADAIALIAHLIGPRKAAAEPAAASELAAQCAYLPLAVRIAAERVAGRAHGTLAGFAAQLAVEHGRLDELSAGDDDTVAVRAAFSWSYRALEPPAARLFRLLGLHPGPDIGAAAAAALAGLPIAAARRLLDVLTSVHLLDETGYQRFRFHDLLRVYAAERSAAEESEDQRRSAIARELAWYLHSADAADSALIPRKRRIRLAPLPDGVAPASFPSRAEALAWCDAERSCLRPLTRLAAESGELRIAWQLPISLWGYFTISKHWDEWIATHRIGLDAARRSKDISGEAYMTGSLGFACWDQRRFAESIAYHRRALELCSDMGDRWGQGIALTGLGLSMWELGQAHQAIASYEEALGIWRIIGDTWAEGHTLNNLGRAFRQLHRFDEAARCLDRVLEIFRNNGDLWGESWALHNIAETHNDLGRPEEAISYCRQAIAARAKIGDRRGEGDSLWQLGRALREIGNCTEARESWVRALAIYTELGDPLADKLRAELGELPPEQELHAVTPSCG